METFYKLTENLRVPGFFRDVIFLMGGFITSFLLIFFLSPGWDESIKVLERMPVNIFSILVFFSLAYFIGRISRFISDMFDTSLTFIYEVISCFWLNKPDIGKQLVIACKILFHGRRLPRNLQPLEPSTPNNVQVQKYIGLNKPLSDEYERMIYSYIVFSQIFGISLLLGHFHTFWWFIISFFILWELHKEEKNIQNMVYQVTRVLVYENQVDKVNRALLDPQYQNKARYNDF